jgi:Fe-S-cluster-containing hydrogenase component 2
MIVINRDKCVGCGTCTAFCPREALEAWWGYAEVNREKCTDCFGGQILFGEYALRQNKPPSKKKRGCEWDRLCIQYCPVEAIEVGDPYPSLSSKKQRIKRRSQSSG